MADAIYTIGHSTQSIERLIELLKSHSITAICDVRSQPYSRMNPQFNREPLKDALRAAGIKYVFLGKELGARSEDRSCYRNGQVHYDLLAQADLFKHGIDRVKEGARSYRVALLCAEKEPLECHRTILVSRRLFEEGLLIKHILGDGQIEEHEHAIKRLISKLRIPEGDMFRSSDAVVSEAYARQGNEIAYREQTLDTSASERLPRQSAQRPAR
jgi:uncharacterized protein (DUF488 family)